MKLKPFCALFVLFLSIVMDIGVTHLAAEKLEQKFYNDYLDSLPNPDSQKQEVLEKNLLRILKRKIPDYDTKNGRRYVKNLSAKEFSYSRITIESKFTRGIFKELPHLKPTEYMWIVKTGPYLILLTFLADPGFYIVDQNQIEVVIENQKETGHS